MIQKKNKIVRRKNNSQKKKKKKIKNSRTWKQKFFILIVIIFIGIIVYIFLCSGLLTIDKFYVYGINNVNKSQIINIIKSDISGNVTSCIKKDNYFIVNKDKISKDILKDNRLKTVNIIKKFPDKIIVEVQEYDNMTIWCKNSAMSTCFLLDGDIVKKQISVDDSIVKNNKHFIIVDNSNQDIAIGEHIMSKELLQKIEILGQELVYALNVKIEQPFKVISRGAYEVQFVTDEGWYIIIDLEQDSQDVLDIARLFTKKVELPSRRSDLEYVDMRFSEKIFYKMKDGVEQNMKDEKEEKNDKS